MFQKAHALAHVLDNIQIFITDKSQIMGYVGSAPHQIVWHWQGVSMVNEEIYNEEGIIPEPEEESLEILANLNDYWGGRTAVDKLARILDPEDAVKFMSGAIGWGTPSSAVTYSTKDFDYIFKGFEAVLAEIEERMDNDSILITTDGPIGIISINNPQRKNAVTNRMLKEVDRVLQQMEGSGVRVVVLTGAGDRIFCSGFDVTTFSDVLSDLEEATEGGDKTDYLRLTLRRIQNVGMPVIAMINGHCIGAGVDISLACDFRYAAAGVKLQVPPAKLGIIYNPEGIQRAINILGLARAKELFFLGESFSSEQAFAMGLLNGVHPVESLEEHTMGIAHTLAENSRQSLRGMKKVFRYCLEHQGLSREREAEVDQMIIDAMRSEDAAEALKAFSERRKPQFKGR